MTDNISSLRAAGLLDVPEFPTRRTPPDDLCGVHAGIWRKWWDYAKSYNPRNPRDFGGAHIADNRTSHAERRVDWLRKGVVQLNLTAEICRQGGPQCGTAERAR